MSRISSLFGSQREVEVSAIMRNDFIPTPNYDICYEYDSGIVAWKYGCSRGPNAEVVEDRRTQRNGDCSAD